MPEVFYYRGASFLRYPTQDCVYVLLLTETRHQTQCTTLLGSPVAMNGPGKEGLAVVIAQPLDLETAQRLRWQADQERVRGASTCRAVVALVRDN